MTGYTEMGEKITESLYEKEIMRAGMVLRKRKRVEEKRVTKILDTPESWTRGSPWSSPKEFVLL